MSYYVIYLYKGEKKGDEKWTFPTCQILEYFNNKLKRSKSKNIGHIKFEEIVLLSIKLHFQSTFWIDEMLNFFWLLSIRIGDFHDILIVKLTIYQLISENMAIAFFEDWYSSGNFQHFFTPKTVFKSSLHALPGTYTRVFRLTRNETNIFLLK